MAKAQTRVRSEAPSALPRQALQAELVPGSFNAEEGTVDVVWSTGARVRFWDWKIGEYDLTLGLESKHVDRKFANSGGPVLDAHAGYSVASVVGRIDHLESDGKRGTATLRLSNRPEVAGIRQDIADGILRFVSVGTRLIKLRDITEEGDAVPHYFAEKHEPLEISLAPIPKDRGAVIQGEKDGERFPVEIVRQEVRAAHEEGADMKPEVKGAADTAAKVTQNEQGGTPPTAPEPSPAPAEVAQKEVNVDEIKQAQEAERARGLEVRKIAKQARLSDEVAEKWITQGTPVDVVRKQALEQLAAQSDALGIEPRISVVRDEIDTIHQSVASALMHRMRPREHKLEQRANEFVGMSMLEIARQVLDLRGIKHRGLSKMEIAKQALHSTSDFPLILENIATKTLRRSYEATPRSFTPWCREATLPDFKQVSRVQMGEAPQLKLVTEGASFSYGTSGESAEKYSLATYGRIIAFTRQALINDDLSAFSRMIEGFAVQAANIQSDVVYAILTANPTMSDTVALFNSAHGNQSGSAGAIAIATLGTMRAAMRVQKGIDGATIINVDPRFLIVPAALETVAQQYLAQISPESSANFNPFAGSLQAIVEPRLDAASTTVWYGAADPAQVDTIEYGFLEGQSGPYMETRNGFEVDGVEFKGRLDFAAKAIDWRGLYRNS